MHLKLKTNKDTLDNSQKRSNRKSQNMASSLVNDDEDNASSTTRNTQQPQQQQPQQSTANNSNNAGCLNQQNNNNNNNTAGNTSANANANASPSKMHGNEAKLKKENLQLRKLELEKLLNEKSWLLQQLQQQESQILKGNFEYMNFNDFIQNLAVQYKQEQATADTGSNSTGGLSQFTAGEESILRRKPLAAKENHQQQQHHNVLHRRQSEISNRSSEYDNYPHQDSLSTHSEGASSGGGRGGAGGAAVTMQHAQAQQQYNAKSALKKRSATVAGTTQQSSTSLQLIRQHHMDQQLIQQHQQQQQQQMLYKQQQQQQQQHYHHPQQHLFKQHLEHHQVLMPHLQYATQKFYYTTLQPTQPPQIAQQQQHPQQPQQPQQQYGRYIKAQPQQQQHHQPQAHIHVPQNPQQQSPNHSQQLHVHYATSQMPTTSVHHQQQQQLLLTPPHSGAHMDNISLYSLNSNNVATLHRQAQQQQPIIVQCDKYYLSPTTHHVSHNDGGGFIKSSQNIKEYISPMNSPQQLLAASREKRMTSQTNLSNRGATPSIDAISLAPSYVSMETVDYMATTSQQQQHHQNNLRWRSQTNLPPPAGIMASADMKSHSSDMLNNNQYYNTAMNPPPSAAPTTHPPNVTQVKPFKPLDEISINSYTSETQKKTKSKQWLESSLDGPVIRQTPHHVEDNAADYANNNNSTQQRSKLSSHSLNTSRHYSMSSAQAKPLTTTMANSAQTPKLSQSTSYLNQMEPAAPATPSISQAYNVEITSPQTPVATAYKYLAASSSAASHNANKPPARPPLYINAGSGHQTAGSPTTGLLSGVNMSSVASSSALSPEIRVESPKNVTVVQPATFQPYKEVTKPFEMSDFYKYSTKYRQKENNNNAPQSEN